ncbi:MAG: hypothetical protein KDB05_28580, partial [Planctomycetales bacterium]|nr:hypothetical protein [Planctomycetales bacterium]
DSARLAPQQSVLYRCLLKNGVKTGSEFCDDFKKLSLKVFWLWLTAKHCGSPCTDRVIGNALIRVVLPHAQKFGYEIDATAISQLDRC